MSVHRIVSTFSARWTVRRPRPARTAVVAGTALLLVAGSLTVAAADPPWPRPQDTTYELSGRGYGHGRGMSQWGAQGAALVRGLTSSQILAFYYPGTASASQGNPVLRVRLDQVDLTPAGTPRGETVVLPAAGLTARSGAVAQTLPTTGAGGPITRWRAVLVPGGLGLQYLDTAWRTFDLMGGGAPASSPLSFATSGQLVTSRVTLVLPSGASRAYRGWVDAVTHTPTGGTTQLRTLNRTLFEDYLRSVVPSEVLTSWAPAALQAQAVAARTFAAYKVAHGGSPPGDVCDTTACQVYTGVTAERASTDAAVAATAGLLRVYGGGPAFTEFSASNGGFSTAGAFPYIVAKADPYDQLAPSAPGSWVLSLPASRIEAAYPAVGRLARMVVLTRTGNGVWGGRVTSVRLVGTAATLTVTGDDLRARLNVGQPTASQLRSTWFTVPRPDSFPRDGNLDGLADLYATTSGGLLRFYPGRLPVGFGPATTVGLSGWQRLPWVATAGDFNGDQRHDLLARTSTGGLVLYLGNGRGGLSSSRAIGSGWQIYSEVVVPGDLDGDNLVDVVAYRPSTGGLWVYRGNGTGGFAGAGRLARTLAGHDSFVPIGDFDGDRRVDLLSRRRSDGALVLLPGTGSATAPFGVPRVVGSGWNAYNGFVGLGDASGDTRADLVARRTSDGTLWLYRPTGTGSWQSRVLLGSGWGGLRLVR